MRYECTDVRLLRISDEFGPKLNISKETPLNVDERDRVSKRNELEEVAYEIS